MVLVIGSWLKELLEDGDGELYLVPKLLGLLDSTSSSSGLQFPTLGGCMRLSSPSLGTVVGRAWRLLPLALACWTAAATDKKLAMAPGDMGPPDDGAAEPWLLLWIREAKEVNGLLWAPPLELELDSGSRNEMDTSWSLPTYCTMAELFRASRIDCSCSVKAKQMKKRSQFWNIGSVALLWHNGKVLTLLESAKKQVWLKMLKIA